MKRNLSKEDVLAELKKLEIKHAPRKIGVVQFEKLTGIPKYQWQNATGLARWSQVRVAAGLQPLEWSPRGDKEDALNIICLEIKRSGEVPTKDELRFLHIRIPKLPAVATLTKWFGNKDGILKALITFAESSTEFLEIVPLLKADRIQPQQSKVAAPIVHPPVLEAGQALSESFIPPVIRCLPDLANGDVSLLKVLEAQGKDPEREMERRVAIALSLLGIQIQQKARPGKEEADGLGVMRSELECWGIIYDAKTKEQGQDYRVSVSERRKFESYIKIHSPILRDQGCRRVHLIVVAGTFEDKDAAIAEDIRHSAGPAVQSVCLLTATRLVSLVDQCLRKQIDDEELERFLAQTGVVR